MSPHGHPHILGEKEKEEEKEGEEKGREEEEKKEGEEEGEETMQCGLGQVWSCCILGSYASEVDMSSKKCTLRWLGTTFDTPFITVLNFKNHFPFFILNIFNSYTLNNEKGSLPAS